MNRTPEKKTWDKNGNSSETFEAEQQDSQVLRKMFPYPDCWQDEERMKVLFSAFRARDVNPEHYDAKMKFWQDMIVSYCEHKGDACFTKRELQLMFARGQRVPYGFDIVLAEMQRCKRIRTRAEYEYDPENSWTGWAMSSFVKKPLSWGMHKLKSTLGATDNSDQALIQYVLVDVLKKFCKKLQVSVLDTHQGELLHYEAFKTILEASGFTKLTEDCLYLCLHTLHCQRKIGLEYKQQREIHLIKIPSKTDPNSIGITQSDHAIHDLLMTQKSIQKQLETLELDIRLNEEKARQYVLENKRQLAKTYLRKKLLLEKNHEKRSLALHNIEAMLSSIEETRSNGEIFDAYKIGSKALQDTLTASGLKYDNVDEVISDVKESIETHNELQDMLSNANLADVTNTYDNDELEQELKQILGEAERKTPAKTRPAAAAANNNNMTDSATPRKIEITDAALLAMLEDLEVEDNSPKQSNTTHSTITE